MSASPGPQGSSVTESAASKPAAEAVKPIYFVADAHLGIESAELEEAKERDLLALLSYLSGRASLLYLVGDTFDFWFEYPWNVPSGHAAVVKAMAELVDSGTPVRFLGGNHDYWAGTKLKEMTGATVHRTPVTDTHFGLRTFVAHGDGLPEGDMGYKVLKSIIRNPISIAAFSLIPAAMGATIARWASGLSEVTEERVRRAIPAMRTFLASKLAEGYDVAVVGHVHKQLVWRHGDGTAVVVGDWMMHRSVVELTEGGLRTLSWKDGALHEEPSETPPEA